MTTLAQNPLFRGVPEKLIEELTRKFPRKTFSRNSVVIEQGTKGKAAYVLLDGKVEVFCESKDGQRVTIIYHEAPFIFGELEVWDERPCLAYVKAIERCEVMVLRRAQFQALVHANHQIAINLSAILSRLLYETGQDRRVKFFGRVENLLANTLGSFAKMYGVDHRYGVLIQKEITNTELADILGVARKSVIQASSKLQKVGLIQKEGRYFVIPDERALRAMAHSF